MYLCKEGAKACDRLDGVVIYGTPWSAIKGSDFFYNNAFGVYQKVIGVSLTENIRKFQLPQMRDMLS